MSRSGQICGLEEGSLKSRLCFPQQSLNFLRAEDAVGIDRVCSRSNRRTIGAELPSRLNRTLDAVDRIPRVLPPFDCEAKHRTDDPEYPVNRPMRILFLAQLVTKFFHFLDGDRSSFCFPITGRICLSRRVLRLKV